GPIHRLFQPLDRPEALEGATTKVRWPESEHALYITVNDIIDDQGRTRPFEIFINSKNTEHYAWTVALTRMISAVFRRGGDVSFVVEELKAVFDPRGGQWMGRRYVPSLLAAIGEVIEAHMIDIGLIPALHDKSQEIVETRQIVGAGENASASLGGGASAGHVAMRACPKCGAYGLIRQENCDICTSCGYSKCS
ncbi:MAG: ribonucleoside-diphosphate reductase, adenosylcobalamin-dependent, partial [Alphaproteobacteria bacterium]|nr:ribonucleoside-diphosphate reductase, adenosylcobalamin-dependent [Alphaproteobacteria bacterium]